jgi:hypothetical protein
MQQNLGVTLRMVAAMCLLACAAAVVFAESEGDLSAKKRLFPTIGPGLRAVKQGADGRTYILASPSPGLVVVDKKGQQVLAIPTAAIGEKADPSGIIFGEDCDADSDGKIYVADRGANAVEVFSPTGQLLRRMSIPAPISVAAIGDGEVAVATLREPHLVVVFDKNGRDVREFGDPEQITGREDLNRFLNIGQLDSDSQGHVYYAFSYTPEATVRQYDRYGYGAGPDVQYTALEAASEAQALRREIVRQEKHQKSPTFKRNLTAVGVDRATSEVWMAVGNTLLRFDKEGNRRASYQLYTPEGARLEAKTILVRPDQLIIGSDPLGIYAFDRPDKSAH